MSFKKSCISIFLGVSVYYSTAQTSGSFQATLPTIVPPSPEVSSLVKSGDASTGLHTGSANANISLFTVTAGSFTMPISLSYSSNGIKVNDFPSRAGLGWNLVAGGSVSRIVHDEADGESINHPPVNFSNQNQDLVDYLILANSDLYDTEFDEYSFSVNGLSGKFYLDASDNGKTIQHSNIKIQKQGTTFVITGADGIKYYFGESGKIEKTRTITLNSSVGENRVQSATWFLTKIETPEGETILFNYNPIFIRTWQGPSQSVVLQQPGYDPNSDCGVCQAHWANATMNAIDYDTYYLTSITSSTGSIVNFTYTTRPANDNSGDNRLAEVTLSTTNAESTPKLIKKYQFEYLDITTGAASSDAVKRYYLKKVKSIPLNTTLQNTEHVMDYNDPDALPSISSYAQDHFGYYNGKYLNGNFFPIPASASSYVNANLGGDRSPDFAYSQKGILKKITYPTKGYQEFYFEPHTLTQAQTTTVYSYATATGNGDPDNAANTKEYITYFSVQNTQTASVSLRSYRTPGYDPNNPTPPTGPDWVIRCYLTNNANGNIIGNWGFTSYTEAVYQASLQPGITYKLRLVVYGGATNAGDAIVSYDPTIITTSVNVPACGVRISQIRSFDPIASKATNKFYKYASLAEPNKSSGMGTLPEYQAYGSLGGVCTTPTGQTIITCGTTLQVSSSSINPTFTFGGSPVAYRHVVEADDFAMQNGGIEHTFFTSMSTTGASNLLGTNILAGPLNISADMNGLEEKKVYFKKSGPENIVLKEVINTYEIDTRINGQRTNVITKKRFNPPLGSFPPWANLQAFDLGEYFFANNWIHLNQTVTKEYDQSGLNPLITTVNYTYGNINHLQPTITQTTNSQAVTVTNTATYPEDYTPGTAVYNQMLTKNIITPVIESVTSKGGVPVSTVKTEYKDWFNDGKILKPEIVKAGKGGTSSTEPRIRYHSYDITGNPLALSKENDSRVLYIWDYNKVYPVAEAKITNASAIDIIAYTSFEADGSGNWTIGSALRDNTTSLTGKKSYSISNGNITLPGLDAGKTYIVSYWTKNTSAFSITGTMANYPVAGRTVNGWKYFEHKLTGQSSVTISGSGFIDELRLYPDKTFMTTYAYDPLIGVTSQCDANNRISYYEYDAFNRLTLIRDQDKNILKKICYNYAGEPENCLSPCTNTAANWQNTALPPSCQVGICGNTGYEIYEQRDMNPCSPTYNQVQPVLVYNPTVCPPSSNAIITFQNTYNLTGFTALYTNNSTGQQYSFSIGNGTGTLGCIPPAAYTLTISKPGNAMWLLFGSGCHTAEGTSATFGKVFVSVGGSCTVVSLNLAN